MITYKNFAEAVILWRVGLLGPGDLPRVGREALVEGLDTSDIRILSSLHSDETDEAVLYFDRICASNTQTPSVHPFILFVQLVSRKILSNQMTAYNGAKVIWEVSLKFPRPIALVADPFVYAASEIEDRPEQADFFSREIEKEARRQLVVK